MRRPERLGRSITLPLVGLVLSVVASCSGNAPTTEYGASTEDAGAGAAPTGATQGALATPSADTSRSIVQRGPRVQVSHAESSLPLRSLPDAKWAGEEDDEEHHVHRIPWPHKPEALAMTSKDPVLQSEVPIRNMPAAIRNFIGQGRTNSPTTITGTPPDTNGVVGPNHYVQTVNGGIEVWSKTGTVVAASKLVNSLWTGYVGTNAGNRCATDNDGDPVVVYDQLADRWFVTQFSINNFFGGAAPEFQCVAVSKTGDPTGAYWLYDFSYPALNDYGKFGIWPDAYYATFNMFNPSTQAFLGADICAYDRVKMLAGLPAAQQCFQQNNTVGGALPVSLDGPIAPPVGEPGFFSQFDYNTAPPLNTLDFWKFHVDWATPASSTLTGPTAVTVAAFTPTCAAVASGNCIPALPANAKLAQPGYYMMFVLDSQNVPSVATWVHLGPMRYGG